MYPKSLVHPTQKSYRPIMAVAVPWQRVGILLGTAAFCIVCLKSINLQFENHRHHEKHPRSRKSGVEGDSSEESSSTPLGMISIPVEEVMAGDPIQLEQDGPRVIQFILDGGYLKPPSDKGYNLRSPNKNPSLGQGQFIRKLFKDMRDGFFIEYGALDGETDSNTLTLEKDLMWKGLLVEPDLSNYKIVTSKQRKAWTSNSCLATKSYPHRVLFEQHFNVRKIKENSAKSLQNSTTAGFRIVQCFPIYSILSALGITTVDYFSLDVEGVEMEVLETIPFNKIFIKTLSVEFNHVTAGKEGLRRWMEDKGYVVVKSITDSINDVTNDFIFVHYSLHDLIAGANETETE